MADTGDSFDGSPFGKPDGSKLSNSVNGLRLVLVKEQCDPTPSQAMVR